MSEELDTRLPPGVRTRRLEGVNGLSMAVLEAGDPSHPLILLLHGFPELGFSWRHQLPALAAAGFHVVAPDQRGYGGTSPLPAAGRLEQVRLVALAADMLALVSALGHARIHLLAGHDFGSPVAAMLALARPDLVERLVLLSAPFPGTPPWPLPPERPAGDWQAQLAALGRKHYQWHYSTDAAAQEMDAPRQGLPAFLSAYYYVKSGDWEANEPFPLAGWTGDELAKLPAYYVMQAELGMAATVAPHQPARQPHWLPEADLAVYARAFGRTGFGPSLLWYRAVTSGRFAADLQLLAGRRIECPTLFVAGARDWGIHQNPGALQAMAARASADWRGIELIPGAGHWVQQEQPAAVTERLLAFARGR